MFSVSVSAQVSLRSINFPSKHRVRLIENNTIHFLVNELCEKESNRDEDGCFGNFETICNNRVIIACPFILGDEGDRNRVLYT